MDMSDQYRLRDDNIRVVKKKSCIDLLVLIERLDIVLSDSCPDIWPLADIAVALLVFMYGQN
jgi:hypothetical protein